MVENGFRFIAADGSSYELPFTQGESVLDRVRRDHPGLIQAPCGGAGTCGKCRVVVVSGEAGDPSPEESKRLGQDGIAAGLRLACRLQARAGLVVAEAAGSAAAAAIQETFGTLSDIPSPVSCESGSYGVAVDIGTTTIAAYLIDFVPQDGSAAGVVASSSKLNKQRPYGADVVARMDYAGRGQDELKRLASLVREDITELADRLLAVRGLPREALTALSVVGNTVMLHLFAATDPSSIAVAPFTPVFVEGRKERAEAFDLPYPRADLYLGSSVAGYVGADLVAAARAVSLEEKEGLRLLLDLGTNGEMALGDKDGVHACATAAGPAFEGANISCGTGGVTGAIDRLRWQDGSLAWSTIGGGSPIGVCGSGIIDAAARLVEAGIADETGALDEPWDDDGYPLAGDGGPRFTQADLRQVQLAKAAVAAGIATLLEERGAKVEDVQAVYLAGGFGNFLDPASAAAIGLIPAELLPRVVPVGNAAGLGAVRLLLFSDEARKMESLARSMSYLELSTSAFFRDRFIDEMFFPEQAEQPAPR